MPYGKRFNVPKEELHHKYWIEKKTQKMIATEYGVEMRAVYHAMQRYEIPRRSVSEQRLTYGTAFKKGVQSVTWKGGKIIVNGYVYIWNKEKQKYEREHRLVMEKQLGRKLETYELVHHIDGNRKNNKPSNLMIVLVNNHRGYHECPQCKYKFCIK